MLAERRRAIAERESDKKYAYCTPSGKPNRNSEVVIALDHNGASDFASLQAALLGPIGALQPLIIVRGVAEWTFIRFLTERSEIRAVTWRATQKELRYETHMRNDGSLGSL
jgi:hypothetical protein